jgi:hypothetical protein
MNSTERITVVGVNNVVPHQSLLYVVTICKYNPLRCEWILFFNIKDYYFLKQVCKNFPRIRSHINLLKSTGYMMHHQFNIQQLYACPHCIYVFCICLRTNNELCHLQHKARLVFIIEMKSVYSTVRTGSLNKAYWSPDAPPPV